MVSPTITSPFFLEKNQFGLVEEKESRVQGDSDSQNMVLKKRKPHRERAPEICLMFHLTFFLKIQRKRQKVKLYEAR